MRNVPSHKSELTRNELSIFLRISLKIYLSSESFQYSSVQADGCRCVLSAIVLQHSSPDDHFELLAFDEQINYAFL